MTLVFSVGAAFNACAPKPPSAGGSVLANGQPLPSPSASSDTGAVVNGTPLHAEPLASPLSTARLYFATPELAEVIPLEALSSYQVRVIHDASDDGSTQIDVALDAGRPRRLSAPFASINLGALMAADASLSPGLHWLFAAPVLDSGLVPSVARGLPRSAIARRFFVAKKPSPESGPSGAVWLRKPEGTYNGLAAAREVLFDVYVFSATGAPQELPSTVTLRGPNVSGELRLPSPFVVHDVPSGDFEVTVSSPTALPVSARFTVNRELGGAP